MSDPVASRLSHVPALDGLRGIAILLVVATHLGDLGPSGRWEGLGHWFGGGFLGVDIFFVLSGFLITSVLLGEHSRDARIDLLRFWRARAFRLLPALAVLLLTYIAYASWQGYPATGTSATTTTSIVSLLTFTFNWKLHLDLASAAAELGHLWSLSIEEQFYAFWPFALIVLLAIARRGRVVATIFIVLMLVVALRRWGLYDADGWFSPYLRTESRIDGMIAGGAAAWFRHRGATLGSLGAPIASAAAVLLVILIAITDDASSSYLYSGGLSLVAICMAIVVFVLADGGWPIGDRLLAWAPLRAIGVVSYGLYLWHYFVFKAVARIGPSWPTETRLAVGLGVSAAALTASRFLNERPAQRWRRQLDRRRVAALRSTPRSTASPLLWAGAACGALIATGAVVIGKAALGNRTGDDLPQFATLRADAMLRLRELPPEGQLLADAATVGGSGGADGWSLLPTLARLPLVSSVPDVYDSAPAISLVVAWLAVVLCGFVLVRLQRDESSLARWFPSERTTVIAAAALVAAWPVAYLFIGAAQDVEAEVWLAVGFVAIATAIIRLRNDVASTWILGGVVAFGALAHPALGIFGAGLIAVLVVGRRIRGQTMALSPAMAAMILPIAVWAVPIDQSSVDVAASHVVVGAELPSTGEQGDLYVIGECFDLYAATPAQATSWDNAAYSWSRVLIGFPFGVLGDGSARVIEFIGEPRTEVTLRAGRGETFRLEVDSDDARLDSHGPWIDAQLGGLFAVSVDREGSELNVTADGDRVGAVPAVDDGGAVRRPDALAADLEAVAALGATVVVPDQFPRDSCALAAGSATEPGTQDR